MKGDASSSAALSADGINAVISTQAMAAIRERESRLFMGNYFDSNGFSKEAFSVRRGRRIEAEVNVWMLGPN